MKKQQPKNQNNNALDPFKRNPYNSRFRFADFERDTVELGIYDILTISILGKQSLQLKRASL